MVVFRMGYEAGVPRAVKATFVSNCVYFPLLNGHFPEFNPDV